MKKRDMVLLGLTIAIFAIGGIVLYGQFGSKSSNQSQNMVDVIAPIAPDFSAPAVAQLSDNTQVVNFSQPINLTKLGNSQPFGPLR